MTYLPKIVVSRLTGSQAAAGSHPDANVLPEKVSAPWFSWPILRWGAGIACIVVVGTAITLRQREVRSPRLATESSAPISAQPATAFQQDGTASRLASAASASVAKPSPSADRVMTRQAPLELRTAPMARMAAQSAAPQAQSDLKAQTAPNSDDTNDLLTKNEIDSLVPGRAKDALEEA